MTRKVLQVFLLLGLFGSCHKTQVALPATEGVATTDFKDDHIYVSAVTLLKSADGNVNFSFSTRYEKGISKIEVFKGSTKSNLCSFYEKAVSGESHSLKTYQAQYTNNGNEVNYYMIKYKTLDGGGSYSSLYTLKLK
ncbi:MAG: hypothetical protein LH478_14045 [Chitinophagaceae bacterium]|nr:hypothetical protein [Chitinophagaceae bacterium]